MTEPQMVVNALRNKWLCPYRAGVLVNCLIQDIESGKLTFEELGVNDLDELQKLIPNDGGAEC